MQLNKLTGSLTHFILMFLLIFIQASAWSDHGGFTATLSATDVVDDGNPNSIEVESREPGTPFTGDTAAHNVNITVYITFDKAAEKPVGSNFTPYFFDKNDERIDEINLTLLYDITGSRKNYTLKIPANDIPTNATVIILRLGKFVKSVERADIEAELADRITLIPTNEEATITLNLVREEPPKYPEYIPKVVSMTRYDSRGFITPNITGPFTVKIVLTEKPRAFTPEHIGVTNGKATFILAGPPFGGAASASVSDEPVEKPPISEGNYTIEAEIPNPTGRDYQYHPYYVTITPDFRSTDDIVIKVNVFEDTVKPPNRYIPSQLVEGRTKLTVRVSPSATLKSKPPGFSVALPHNDNASIPANGFYILTKNSENSGIDIPPVEEGAIHRRQTQLAYNVRENSELPNLESLLLNGGTIDLVGPAHIPAGSVIISEIMWGSDRNLADATESQWVELYNTTDARIPIDEGTWFLYFYGATEPVPHPKKYGIIDRIGTVDPASHAYAASNWWSIAGKGQSGRTGTGSIQPLISMERIIYATGEVADGTKTIGWTASTRPSVNFDFTKAVIPIGTPGTMRLTPIPKPVSTPEPTLFPAGEPDIVISEIMYTGNRSQLPQWIELHNRSGREVNLLGWEVLIENPSEDETVLETSVAAIFLDDILVAAGEAVLLVTEQGRHSGIGEGKGDLRRDQVIGLKQLLNIRVPRYKLLSNAAFKISLISPSATAPVDIVGNLGAKPAWELPTLEEGASRSSIVRNYRKPKRNGTRANGWLLASEQAFLYAQHGTYYGHSSDHGTPGYRAGSPLPVQLSSFRPARQASTGAVGITWVTESELDNAGFNILRSTTRDDVFSRVNTTLISGAGTTAEKHTYSFTDTTATPNIVYYYRIEDVSLAGEHRTLATVRLKGHVSASGKLTTTWGLLKTQN